jgi:hypothetical protein
MSLIKANAVQIGQSGTATQNFTLAVPSSPDGTIKLARGNSGATTQDVISVDASGNINGLVKSTGSTTARSLANRFADVVNVKDFGAVGDGVTDDTAAIQAAINSIGNNGSSIYFPQGTYYLNTTQPAPYPTYFNPVCLLVQNKSNFSIRADGASLVVGNTAAFSSLFHFDKCNNFLFSGFRLVGNKTGVSPIMENCAVTLTSCVKFNVSDLLIDGNWGGLGAGIIGDWMVDGIFQNIRMPKAGIIVDVAYLMNVVFSNVIGYGADNNGNNTGTAIGQKGFSIINDTPNISRNFTGITFSNTDNVQFQNCVAENFATGCAISAGSNINFFGCSFSSNDGGGSALGIGLYLYYDNSVLFSSAGVAPTNISVVGCKVYNNGIGIVGSGIYIDASTVTGSDKIKNVLIGDTDFDNNSNIGISSNTTANISNVMIINNSFSGPVQSSYSGEILAVATIISNDATFFQTGVTFNNSAYFKNSSAVYFKNSSAVDQPIIGVSSINVAYVRPASALANIQLQNFAGSPVLQTIGGSSLSSLETGIYLLCNNGTTTSLQLVTLGASNSGGSGFRSLVVPN